MGNGLTKKVNITALIIAMLMIMVACFCRKQTVTYDLTGDNDSSITLGPGETVIQTYSPNRRAITSFDFKLKEEMNLNGKYTLVVTDKDTPDEDMNYSISNSYTGENTDSIRFKLPKKYNPQFGTRLNLFIISDAGNKDAIELASSSFFRSAYYYDAKNYERKLGDSTLALTVVSEKNYKWFLYLCVVLLTMGTTFVFMHFFKNDFEDNVGISIMSLIFTAYFMGIIGVFRFAPAFLILASAIGIVLFFYDCTKSGRLFYKSISSGMVLWMVVITVLFVFIHHNIIGDPDTVFHMGKCKYMFWTDELAFAPGYHFLIPVFAFLFERINGVFVEDFFLLAIKIYEFSLLFTFLNVVKVNDKKKNVILKIVILTLCTILTVAVLPNAYFTAMMDIPFAVTIAYTIKNIYLNKFTGESIYKIISSSLALVLIKRSGIPVILLIILLLLFHAFRFGKSDNKVRNRYLMGALLVLLVCITVSKIIDMRGDYAKEKLYTDDASNFAHISPEYIEDGIYREMQPVPTRSAYARIGAGPCALGIQFNEIRTFSVGTKLKSIFDSLDAKIVGILVNAFLFTDVFMGMSYAEALAVIVLLAIVAWLIKKDEESFQFLKNMVELAVAAFLYYGAIAYKYLFRIEGYNMYNLNAYDRYAIHFIGAIAIFEAVYLIKILRPKSDDKDSDLRLVFIGCVMLIVSCLETDFSAVTNWIDKDMVAIESKTEGLERALAIYYGYGKPMTVYTANKTFDQLSYYVKRINLECWSANASFNFINIDSVESYDRYEWYLYSTFEYFYLVNYDTYFMNNCKDFFENGLSDIKRHALYHVDKDDDGRIKLVYLGQIPLEDNILRTPDGRERIGE